jgi:membrane protein YdbS with pleckstrin-like domain
MATVEQTPSTKTSGPSLPVIVLTILGTVIAVLGFFAGGSIAWTTVGLGAVVVAGVIGLLERLIDSRERQ